MKCVAAILGLTLLFAGPALAQSASDPPDKERLALAQEYIEATGGAKQARAQSKAMFDAMFAGMAKGLPANSTVHLDKTRAEMEEIINSLFPKIIDDMTEVYAEDFTADELRDMLGFMKSSTGQAMIHKLPTIMQQLMTRMVPLINTEIPKLATHMVDDVCADQHCTADQRSALLAKVSAQFSASPSASR